MKTIVHIAAEIEPVELHGAKSVDVFGAHIAFEVREATNEAEAADEFETFLMGLPAGSFHLISVRKDTGAIDFAAALTRLFPATSPRGNEIYDWLSDCKTAYDPSDAGIAFFNTGAAREVADMQNLRALELLRTTARWPAPLAQDNGLTVAVSNDFVRDDDYHYAVLYLRDGQKPSDLAFKDITIDGDLLSAQVTSSAGAYLFDVSLGLLAEFRPANELFAPDGLLAPPQTSNELSRLGTRVQQQAPSLFSISSALVDAATNKVIVAAIASITPGELDGASLPTAERLWFERAATATLFDSILIAMLYPDPSSPTNRLQSTILGLLVRSIASRYDDDKTLEINELTLYKNIFNFLSRNLPKTFDVWDSIKTSFGDYNQLPEMQRAFSPMTLPAMESWTTWKAKISDFTGDLSKLSVFLESESGFEAWLLSQCDRVLVENGRFNPALLIGTNILDGSNDVDRINRATDDYLQFKRFIGGNFDAAETVRQDFGRRIVFELVGAGLKDAGELEKRLQAVNWLKNRVSDTGSSYKPVVDVCFDIEPTAAIASSGLDKYLGDLFYQRVAQIVGTSEAGKLFRTDPSPLPLSIQVTSKVDPVTIEYASSTTSGLGFLVRSRGPTQDETAHASLIDLYSRQDSNTTPLAEGTVLPTLLGLNGGNTGLFVFYEGMPLATPNKPIPGLGGAERTAEQLRQERLAKSLRGYRVAEAEKSSAVPALAYGLEYNVTGFWMPGSGVLPMSVREKPDNPFKPGPPNGNFKPADANMKPYLRRTGIAATKIEGTLDIPSGVQPLANDDPRLVVEHLAEGLVYLDLFRLQDGTGGLDPTTQEIRFLNAAIGGTLAIDDLVVQQVYASNGNLVSSDVVKVLQNGVLTVTPKGVSSEPFWLRLSWKEAATGSGVLSINDPSHDYTRSDSKAGSSLMLLAPDKADWVLETTGKIKAQSPTVSFADFECWARNSALWAATTNNSAKGSKLFEALRWAHSLFVEMDDPYAHTLMKELPDPAVRRLLVAVAPSDGLSDKWSENGLIASMAVDINCYYPEGLDIPEKALALSGADKEEEAKDTVRRLRKMVDDIIERAKLELEVDCGLAAISSTKLTLPAGSVHRLLVSPAVRSDHFAPPDKGGVFDQRQLDISIGRSGNWTLFDGARLSIEIAAPIAAASAIPPLDRLASTSADVERAFSLDYRPRPEDRIFSFATPSTQQWQPTGQPIYRWIAPVPDGKVASKPVIPIRITANPRDVGEVLPAQLWAFEQDAFRSGDQPPEPPKVRLLPYPAATLLDRFSWPEHSATFYRHRVKLHSRYAAAAKNPERESVFLSEEAGKWSARTAILAAPLAAPISRPQVRAFFPGQRSIQANPVNIPPIGCILSEPQYVQLGLADRVDADLITTNTFTFKLDSAGNDQLRVDGLRKQFGPDPLLGYLPVRDEPSRAVTISAEGPVGLHFDEDNTAHPAFSNCQYMLHITIPEGRTNDGAEYLELEESFAGLSLSRYADPAWSWAPGESATGGNTTELSSLGTSWITIDRPVNLIGKDSVPIVEILENGSGDLIFKVARSALFEAGGDDAAELCTISKRDRPPILLIHPLSDSRYRISVYKARDLALDIGKVTDFGHIGHPQLMASVIVRSLQKPALSQPAWLRTTRQSDATFMEWVRTARNMAHLMARDAAKPDDEEARILSDELTAFLPSSSAAPIKFVNGSNKPLHLMSPVAVRRYPLHVHRHLALILRKPSKQVGRQIDLFDKAFLLDGGGGVSLAASAGSTLVIAEVETRAEILHVLGKDDKGVVGLERFGLGYFDLLSSRHKTIEQLRLRFRAATKAVDLTKLRIVLKAVDTDPIEISIDKAVLAPVMVRSFDVLLYRSPDGAFDISWPRKFVDKEKTTLVGVKNAKVGSLMDAEGFTVKIQDIDGADDERWLDVSLLHSSKPRRSPALPDIDNFDFDWLFGSPDIQKKLPDALDPKVLNNLPEAQARLIGFSEAIRINQVT